MVCFGETCEELGAENNESTGPRRFSPSVSVSTYTTLAGVRKPTELGTSTTTGADNGS